MTRKIIVKLASKVGLKPAEWIARELGIFQEKKSGIKNRTDSAVRDHAYLIASNMNIIGKICGDTEWANYCFKCVNEIPGLASVKPKIAQYRLNNALYSEVWYALDEFLDQCLRRRKNKSPSSLFSGNLKRKAGSCAEDSSK